MPDAALPWPKAWLTGTIRTLVKRINGLPPDHRNSAAYHVHRFPSVTVSELDARIAGPDASQISAASPSHSKHEGAGQ